MREFDPSPLTDGSGSARLSDASGEARTSGHYDAGHRKPRGAGKGVKFAAESKRATYDVPEEEPEEGYPMDDPHLMKAMELEDYDRPGPEEPFHGGDEDPTYGKTLRKIIVSCDLGHAANDLQLRL